MPTPTPDLDPAAITELSFSNGLFSCSEIPRGPVVIMIFMREFGIRRVFGVVVTMSQSTEDHSGAKLS